MKIISEAAKNVMAILGKAKSSNIGYRLIKYCVEIHVDEGVLLFNTLTRELVLLSKSEYDGLLEMDELKNHWFVVPDELNEKETADTVRWILRNTAKNPQHITSYTIMTTTDCNARCFYCFEKGCTRTPMSEQTAHKTARYIKEHCGDERVKLAWFGGEPLLNTDVINIICEDLCRDDIEFYSIMSSNGYLFDSDAVDKAKTLWNLKRVQITLDGTEEIYNRSKAYIYNDGKSPYQVVMAGIERLLNAGISVVIRLNLDLYNAEDLMKLVDELSERFSGNKALEVYAHHLFDADISMAETHTDDEWQPRYEAMYRLNDKIYGYGIGLREGIKKNLKIVHCMADSGNACVISPMGNIGLCEHYTESELIGHIDKDTFDEDMVAHWRERTPEIPECKNCFLYPECIKLKNCTANSMCFVQEREAALQKLKRAMLMEYRRSQQNIQPQENEDEVLC